MTLFVFSLLIVFFALALVAERFVKNRTCAICAAVSLTWLTLLIIRLIGYEVDSLTIGILMGGSAVGFMYFLSSKLHEQYEILKFPFLLTLIWLFYHIISGPENLGTGAAVIIGLWIIFGLIFMLYTNDKLKQLGKKIIECCKNW